MKTVCPEVAISAVRKIAAMKPSTDAAPAAFYRARHVAQSAARCFGEVIEDGAPSPLAQLSEDDWDEILDSLDSSPRLHSLEYQLLRDKITALRAALLVPTQIDP